ncbi:MAG TPA: ABC transporter permease [Armatimonadota bacterium]|jgi:putative ABC transport system permease protein
MGVAFTTALRGLATNKLRAFLTMLGVIFGVGAVIVAVALGQGSRDASMRRFQRLGTTTLTVFPGRQSRAGVSFGQVSTLKLPDAAAVVRGCPSVRRVSAEKSGFQQVKYGNKNTNTSIYGTSADFPLIRRFTLKEGKYFDDQDVKAKRMVCILGWQAFKDLFDTGNCIGKRVYIKGASFKVMGLFAERGGGGFVNEDDRVYIPVTTALHRVFGDEVLNGLSVEGRSESLMQRAQDEVTEVLRERHKLGTDKPSDFIVFNAATAAATSSEQAADFEQLINCLAAVALVVGGIGIMNIMLVSVTERTREIGVRKAIGAKRRDILMQFLLEALFLSLTGGLIGVAFGIMFTLYGLPELKPDWETSVTLPPSVLAFGISAIVGVFFGFYPAMKASKLNPIEALRYE